MKASLTIIFVLFATLIFAQRSNEKDLISLNDTHISADNLNSSAGSFSGMYTDDRDGTVYQIMKVGEKVWMSQNLNFVSSDSWCYNEKKSFCEEYGRLYTYESAKNVCPDGWHLPSNEEWQSMIDQLLKEREGKTLTMEEKNNGFNTALAGWRSKSGNFYNNEETGYYWTSTLKMSDYALYRYINSLSHEFFNNYHNIGMAFSVRCIKE